MLLAGFVLVVLAVLPAPVSAADCLGPEFKISLPGPPEADQFMPSVIFAEWRNEFLVVWHNQWIDGSRDIGAARLALDGTLLGTTIISTGAYDRLQPAVAYNWLKDEYFVIWMYDAQDDDSSYEIWGRTVARDFSSMGPEIKIFGWANRGMWTPRIAWDSLWSRYLVVWNAIDTTNGYPNDVSVQLLSDTGAPIGIHKVVRSGDQPHHGEVVYNRETNRYMVVGTSVGAGGNFDVWGALYSPDGERYLPDPDLGLATAEDELNPALAACSDFEILYESYTNAPDPYTPYYATTDWYVMRLFASGTTAQTNPAPPPGVTRQWVGVPGSRQPAVAFSTSTEGGTYECFNRMYVWERDGAIWGGSYVNKLDEGCDGSELDSGTILTTGDDWTHARPDVAGHRHAGSLTPSADSTYLVVYEADAGLVALEGAPGKRSGPTRYIYGRFWRESESCDREGVFSDGFESGDTTAWSAVVP